MKNTIQLAQHIGLSAEWVDWYQLSPQDRWRESGRMWETFQALGGSFEPEPDSQSPFFDEAAWRPKPAHGRTGLRILRSCGV